MTLWIKVALMLVGFILFSLILIAIVVSNDMTSEIDDSDSHNDFFGGDWDE